MGIKRSINIKKHTNIKKCHQCIIKTKQLLFQQITKKVFNKITHLETDELGEK